MFVHIVVAVIIFVVVWLGIGVLPEPKSPPAPAFPIRWMLYVLDIVALVWYLSRFL